MRIGIRVEVSQYAMGISWLRDLLYSAEYDISRLEVTAAKIQQGLPELKRDGNNVVNALYANTLWTANSASQATGLLKQIEFSPFLVHRLKTEPHTVVKDLKELRKHMTNPSNLRISITGNVLGLHEPRSAWTANYESVPLSTLSPVPWQHQHLSDIGKEPATKAIVLSLPAVESSFGVHVTRMFRGWDHRDSAIIKLACEVLDGSESFFWKYIRGSGLAYGANLGVDLENGLLSLSLYDCPNSYLAYAEAAKVVREICSGKISIEQTLDAAKGSLVYGIAQSVGSPGAAATMAFVNETLRGTELNYGREMPETLQPITVEQIRKTIKTYILPLFNAKSSAAFVVSAPGEADEIKGALEDEGFVVERRTLEIPDDEMEGGGSDSGDDSDTSMSLR